MANLFFKRIPETSKLESAEAKLNEEYKGFNEFKNSQELKDYLNLEKFVTSDEFAATKKEIESQKFSDTEEYRKEQEYENLKKSSKIKDYYKLKNSGEFETFNQTAASQELKDYEELDQYINSSEFIDFKAKLNAQRYKDTDEYNKEKDYHRLRKSRNIKNYFKFKKSSQLEEFKRIEASQELKDYEELDKYINSSEFTDAKRNADAKEYKNSEEYRKEQDYNRLKKSGTIKRFFKIKNSKLYNNFVNLNDSDELKRFEELETKINSAEFKEFKEHMLDKKKFEKTDEYKKEQEYNRLKKSRSIIAYQKMKNSKLYANFLDVDDSNDLKRYEELEVFVNSDEFKQFKEHMLDKKKFEKTDEYKKEQEYLKLKQSEQFVNYFKLKESDKFDFLENWEITFQDEFDGSELDRKKWITKYKQGKSLIDEGYSVISDLHFPTDGNNIEINNSVLKIVTRKENVTGKVWDPTTIGFYDKDFEYTSGLISTGESFKQKYGIFKAKIRLNHAYPVCHVFWILSDSIVPVIDIFKYHSKKKNSMLMTNYWNGNSQADFNKNEIVTKGKDFTKDFFIYSLEWSPDKLVWKINDVVVGTQTNGVPQEPMYIMFNSTLPAAIDSSMLPVAMEIDWIRCYQQKDSNEKETVAPEMKEEEKIPVVETPSSPPKPEADTQKEAVVAETQQEPVTDTQDETPIMDSQADPITDEQEEESGEDDQEEESEKDN